SGPGSRRGSNGLRAAALPPTRAGTGSRACTGRRSTCPRYPGARRSAGARPVPRHGAPRAAEEARSYGRRRSPGDGSRPTAPPRLPSRWSESPPGCRTGCRADRPRPPPAARRTARRRAPDGRREAGGRPSARGAARTSRPDGTSRRSRTGPRRSPRRSVRSDPGGEAGRRWRAPRTAGREARRRGRPPPRVCSVRPASRPPRAMGAPRRDEPARGAPRSIHRTGPTYQAIGSPQRARGDLVRRPRPSLVQIGDLPRAALDRVEQLLSLVLGELRLEQRLDLLVGLVQVGGQQGVEAVEDAPELALRPRRARPKLPELAIELVDQASDLHVTLGHANADGGLTRPVANERHEHPALGHGVGHHGMREELVDGGRAGQHLLGRPLLDLVGELAQLLELRANERVLLLCRSC